MKPSTVTVGSLATTVLVMALAFDVRGEEGGTLLQFSMAGANAVAFGLLAWAKRFRLPTTGIFAVMTYTWLGLLTVGLVVAIHQGVDIGRAVRTAYPFCLFLQGLVVSWWSFGRLQAAAALVRWMYVASVTAMVFTFWWGFRFTGLGLSEIRYQVASPLLAIALPLSAYYLVVQRRHWWRNLLILAFAIMAIAVSVTRGHVLTIALLLFALVTSWAWNILTGDSRIPRKMARTVALSAGGTALAVGILLSMSPLLGARWAKRSLTDTNSITLVTRVAAVIGQWEMMREDVTGLLVGRGFGSEYHYAPQVIATVAQHLTEDVRATPKWFPGEIMWMSLVFYGGLLVGGVVAVLLFGAFFMAARLLSRSIRKLEGRTSLDEVSILSSLVLLAHAGPTLTANPFITRQAALFFGLAVGLVLSASKVVVRRRTPGHF